MIASRFAWRGLAAAASLTCVLAAHAGGPPDLTLPDVPTDRLIVKLREAGVRGALPPARLLAMQAKAARRGLRLELLRETALGAQVLQLDRRLGRDEAAELAASLQAEPDVEYAEPDRILQPLATANDSHYAKQWDLHEATAGIRAPQAWDLVTGSGVVVAVIDTGYRPHADLAPNIVTGWDFIKDATIANDGGGRDSDARDPGDWVAANACGSNAAANSSWHGTHVAGTVAAVRNNASGIAGVAPSAKVQPLRVLGRCGGYTSDIADAMVWAAGGSVSGLPANATPARVLNLSLGGAGACDTTTQNAINAARSRKAVVVVAAGNSGVDATNYSPASCAGVVTVAATDRYGARAYYSNFGSKVALAAPGGDGRASGANAILSTLNTGTTTPAADNYAYYQGISMAAPHVAGVAALMLSRNPALTPDEVAAKLKSTARAFPGSCSGCGAGLLDAHAAVLAAAPEAAPPPVAPPVGTMNETEPNDGSSTANPVPVPATVSARIGHSADRDGFLVTVPAGGSVTLTVTPALSTLNVDLHVYDMVGNKVGVSTQPAGQPDRVVLANGGSVAVKRYAQVRFRSGGVGDAGRYTLDVR